jgi:hypothetical protein
MLKPTVMGTPGAFVVFGQLGTVARRERRRRGATIGFLPDDSDRWWPLPERRCVVAIALPKSPPQECPGPPTRTLLPWSPPSGRPASGGHGFVLLRGQWWWSDGARPALSRCRPVAWPEISPGWALARVLPAGRRVRASRAGPRHRARDQRSGTTRPAAGDDRTKCRGRPARDDCQGRERKVAERHEKPRCRR